MDLTDEDLVRRAVRYPPTNTGAMPRWSHVGAIFGIGSTSAAELCVRFGFDPDEVIGNPRDEDDLD